MFSGFFYVCCMRIFLLQVCLACAWFSSYAQVTFQKSFGGNSVSQGFSSCATSDGGCIVGGGSNAFGNSSQVFAVRLDSTGTIKWSRNYGSILSDNFKSMLSTPDDGFIGCGTTMGNGQIDILLLRCDSVGDTIWTRSIGGLGAEEVIGFAKCPDSSYIVFGTSGLLYDEFFLLKVDETGNILWTKIMHVSNSYLGHSIGVSADGSIFVSISVVNPYFATTLTKISKQGVLQWSKKYGYPNIGLDLFSIAITTDGGVIMSGSQNDWASVAIIRVDQNGDIIWKNKYYGGSDDYVIYSIIQASDSNFFATGYLYNPGGLDIVIFRFDQTGYPTLTNRFGRAGYDEKGFSIVESKDGGFFISGNESDTNIYVRMYLAKFVVGNNACDIRNTQLINVGDIVMEVDSFQLYIYSTVMTPSGIPIILGTGSIDNTICNTIGIAELSDATRLQIFPNPSNGVFHISFSEINPYEKLIVFNALGESIFNLETKNQETLDIDLSGQVPGIYLLRFEDGNQYQTARICLVD